MWWRCSPPFKEQAEAEVGSNEDLERLGLLCSFQLMDFSAGLVGRSPDLVMGHAPA